MKRLLILLFVLFCTQTYGQKFTKVKSTRIDSLASMSEEYRTDIEFKLDCVDKKLVIYEDNDSFTVRFDIAHHKRNGVYLITIGKPDYFIVNDNWVLHHRELSTEIGAVIIRDKYTNDLNKL